MISRQTLASTALLLAVSAQSAKAGQPSVVDVDEMNVGRCKALAEEVQGAAQVRQTANVVTYLKSLGTKNAAAILQADKAGGGDIEHNLALELFTKALYANSDDPSHHSLAEAFAKGVTMSVAAYDPKDLAAMCREDAKSTTQIVTIWDKIGRTGLVDPADAELLVKSANQKADADRLRAANMIGGTSKLNQLAQPGGH